MALKLICHAAEAVCVSKQTVPAQAVKVHDDLLRAMPSGAVHDPELCPVCTSDRRESEVGVNTYSEDELRAEVDRAVAEATATMTAELERLRGRQAQADVEATVAAALEQPNARIAELESQLDAAVIQANDAREERDQIVTYLAEVAAANEAAAAAAARRSERMAAVAEVANFSEEQLEERADRWAAMSDDDFAAVLADYRTVAESKKAESAPPPAATAMTAAAPPDNGSRTSATRSVLSLRGTPVAPSSIN